MKTLRPFLPVIGYVVAIHLLCLITLTLCRVVLCISNMPAEGIEWSLCGQAMLIGLKFDNLIACYISSLPFIFLPLFALFTLHRKEYDDWMQVAARGVAWYYGVLYAIVIFIHIANARYYHFFENHINIGITEWFGFVDETAGLLFGDRTNWLFILIALVLIVLYMVMLVRIRKRFASLWTFSGELRWSHYAVAVGLTILLWGATFCGMRGSFQRYPLHISFAYFCSHPFYNRLGINPLFNFIKSADYMRDREPEIIRAVDESEALAYVQRELAIVPVDSLLPIVREANVHRRIKGKPNVILIFMESMAMENLERKENGEWLTPYLRSLRDKSIYWTHCYSAGVHTNNGIVGVHYGFVPNFSKSIMNGNSTIYTGLPYYLLQEGYETMCFVTGNPQYDNMNSFWRDNHIRTLYSLYDYDADAAVNNFGVQDSYMFDFGLRTLSERSQEGKPIFASFLTVSNHDPHVVPEAYIHRAPNSGGQMIAYADDAIRQFIEAAQQTEWGKDALFILVGDHGAIYPSPYEMVLSYNHVPVFLFGAGLAPQQVDQPASQIDIWPTVLSLIGIPFYNNCLGVDILNESRRYAFFVNDDHLGVSDGAYFWCYGLQNQCECLYRIGEGENIIESEPERAADMREYGLMMQRINLLAITRHWTTPYVANNPSVYALPSGKADSK